jgi:hypothetical protein
VSEVRYFDKSAATYDEALLRDRIGAGLGWTQLEVVRLPLPGSANEADKLTAAADAYIAVAERKSRLRALGDITGFEHLEPYPQAFLDDHPDPARNMFVMMRFQPSPQLIEAHDTIVKTLAARNMTAIRVDDRDYPGDLWMNLEVCILGCQYGVAVYEDIDARDFNPNVALEVGYMLARRKRVLILKEQRLPKTPSDLAAGKLSHPYALRTHNHCASEQTGHLQPCAYGRQRSATHG